MPTHRSRQIAEDTSPHRSACCVCESGPTAAAPLASACLTIGLGLRPPARPPLAQKHPRHQVADVVQSGNHEPGPRRATVIPSESRSARPRSAFHSRPRAFHQFGNADSLALQSLNLATCNRWQAPRWPSDTAVSGPVIAFPNTKALPVVKACNALRVCCSIRPVSVARPQSLRRLTIPSLFASTALITALIAASRL